MASDVHRAFRARRDGGQVTPASVKLRPGEVYKFSADWGLTDDGLRAFGPLAGQATLLSLSLFKCKYLTESGLCSVQAFRHLWELDLAETNTTDKVLKSLHLLTSLRRLAVTKCPVSAEAVDMLRQALPHCEVVA
jgi:hypothetical protein